MFSLALFTTPLPVFVFNSPVVHRPAARPPPPHPVSRPTRLLKCIACHDQVHPDNLVKAACSHHYCGECLSFLFRTSMQDETLYPPRCCKLPISFQDARKLLPNSLAKEFKNRQEELDTANKIYCHDPHCSAFVKPRMIHGNHVRCSRCKKATCADCKSAWHPGECVEDEATKELFAATAENKWRRCPRCYMMIERKYGCNRMTCRCKHQFCWACGEKWKTCACVKWDDEQLRQRAERAMQFPPPQVPVQLQRTPKRDTRRGAREQRSRAEPRAPPHTHQAPQAELYTYQPQAYFGHPQPWYTLPGYALPAHTYPTYGVIAPHVETSYAAQPRSALNYEQALANVENNHGCGHDTCRHHQESGNYFECELCGAGYYNWINQCERCLLLMCTRCKQNRLGVYN